MSKMRLLKTFVSSSVLMILLSGVTMAANDTSGGIAWEALSVGQQQVLSHQKDNWQNLPDVR